MKLLALAALALLTIPASAQPAETCLTKTLWGDDIDPPMCFVPEGISQPTGTCDYVLIVGPPPQRGYCATKRPRPVGPED